LFSCTAKSQLGFYPRLTLPGRSHWHECPIGWPGPCEIATALWGSPSPKGPCLPPQAESTLSQRWRPPARRHPAPLLKMCGVEITERYPSLAGVVKTKTALYPAARKNLVEALSNPPVRPALADAGDRRPAFGSRLLRCPDVSFSHQTLRSARPAFSSSRRPGPGPHRTGAPAGQWPGRPC
jgi:hypothetical protein